MNKEKALNELIGHNVSVWFPNRNDEYVLWMIGKLERTYGYEVNRFLISGLDGNGIVAIESTRNDELTRLYIKA